MIDNFNNSDDCPINVPAYVLDFIFAKEINTKEGDCLRYFLS